MVDLSKSLSESLFDWQIGTESQLNDFLKPFTPNLRPSLTIGRLPSNCDNSSQLELWRPIDDISTDLIQKAHEFASNPPAIPPITLFGHITIKTHLEYSQAFIAGLYHALESIPDSNKHWIVSPNLFVDTNQLLFFIVGLDRQEYNQIPHLNSLFFEDAWIGGRYYLPRSFIESVVITWCMDHGINLIRNPSGGGYQVMRDREEILRMAGVLMTDSLVARSIGRSFELYQCVDVLSAMPYEGSQNKGQIVFGSSMHSSLSPQVVVTTPFSPAEVRGIRKVLEMVSENYCIGLDGTGFYGLVQISDITDGKEDVFSVKFRSHHEWSLCYRGREIMVTINGLPGIPREKLSVHELENAFDEQFPEHVETRSSVIELVRAASGASHGTIIVICEDAAAESNRLKDQAIPIETIRFTPENIERYTRIDGALILDPAAQCHAIGVILDGRASSRADRQRGARYNSALRYIDSHTGPAIAVIVSEDGMVKIVTPTDKPA